MKKIILISSTMFLIIFSLSSYGTTSNIGMLPNTTMNKAYTSADSITLANPSSATTEYIDAEYNQVNTSNNVYHQVSAIGTQVLNKYTYERWTFNISNYTWGINWLQYCYEGYYITDNNGYGTFYFYNTSSSAWASNFTLTTSDATYCTNFTNSSLRNITSSQGLLSFGLSCRSGTLYSTTECYTDLMNITFSYTPAITDTCTPTANDYYVKCSDNCDLTGTNINVNRLIIYGDNGNLLFKNINASSIYFNATRCNAIFVKPFLLTIKANL